MSLDSWLTATEKGNSVCTQVLRHLVNTGPATPTRSSSLTVGIFNYAQRLVQTALFLGGTDMRVTRVKSFKCHKSQVAATDYIVFHTTPTYTKRGQLPFSEGRLWNQCCKRLYISTELLSNIPNLIVRQRKSNGL